MTSIHRQLWRAIAGGAAALLLATTSAGSLAQTYPNRPVRMVVPFPPGGGFDAIARPFAERLGTELGQTIVVDNRAGAGGNMGTDAAARSPADGYTLLFANDYLGTNPNLNKKVTYDPVKDLLPIAQVGLTAIGIAVSPALPAKNLQELIALSRTRALSYGTPGIGTSPHLFAEMVAFKSGLKVMHVPYKGTGPAITDAMGGQIDMVITTLTALAPHIRSGKLRGIAVGGAARSALVPDLPTLAEAGVKDASHEVWYGLFVPAGTPAPIVQRLRDASQAVLARRELVDRLKELGYEVGATDPAALGEHLRSDLGKWRDVVERANITVE